MGLRVSNLGSLVCVCILWQCHPGPDAHEESGPKHIVFHAFSLEASVVMFVFCVGQGELEDVFACYLFGRPLMCFKN